MKKWIIILTRTWLGSMFLYSASLKLLDYKQSGRIVKRYAILPDRASIIASFALPWAELLAAISLLFGQFYPIGPLLSTMLGSSFVYASRSVLKRGTDVPCGCIGHTEGKVSKTTLNRGLAITISSLFILTLDRRSYAPLPKLSLWSSLCLCTLSSLLFLVRKVKLMQLRKRQAEHREHRITQLSQILTASSQQSTSAKIT